MRRKSITIQLDLDLYEEIIALARKNHLSIASQIRLMLAPQLRERKTCLDTSIKDKIK